MRLAYVNPLKVLSQAKSARSFARRSSSSNTSLAAATAASSGFSGDRPVAMRSAFTKFTTRASFGRYSLANVVLPAPFGPAINRERGANFFRVLLVATHHSYPRETPRYNGRPAYLPASGYYTPRCGYLHSSFFFWCSQRLHRLRTGDCKTRLTDRLPRSLVRSIRCSNRRPSSSCRVDPVTRPLSRALKVGSRRDQQERGPQEFWPATSLNSRAKKLTAEGLT